MELTKEVAYKAIAEFFSIEKPFVLFGTEIMCARFKFWYASIRAPPPL